MKTEYKHITFRADKNIYAVKVRANGKQINKTAKTLSEALLIRAELYRLAKIEVFNEITLSTFADYAKKFLSDIKCKVKPSTMMRYENIINNINTYVGNQQINTINNERWHKILSTINNGYSPNYMRSIINTAKAIYKHFHLDCPISFSVHVHNQNNRRAFTDKEKNKFLITAHNNFPFHIYFLFYLYFETGCRKAELPALTWDDVDFESRVFTIAHSINKGKINNVFTEFVGETKTYKTRIIPFSFKVLTLLMAMKKKSKSKYVFAGQGKYEWLSLSAIDRYFAKIRLLANLPSELVLHCCRHYFCTKLIANNVDISTVQALSGHSSSRVLLDVYSHSTTKNLVEAIKKLH